MQAHNSLLDPRLGICKRQIATLAGLIATHCANGPFRTYAHAASLLASDMLRDEIRVYRNFPSNGRDA